MKSIFVGPFEWWKIDTTGSIADRINRQTGQRILKINESSCSGQSNADAVKAVPQMAMNQRATTDRMGKPIT